MASHTNATGTPPSDSLWDSVVSLLRQGSAALEFLAIVVGAYLVGRALRWVYMKMGRGRPTSAQLLAGKGIMLLLVAAGIWLGLRFVFDIDPVGLFATLGIVSLALGFGLQNTVANLAAGVSLSLDKPFDVGDRIRVGQTWGDVLSIGFRSTSIRTTAGENVVVPNAILDTQEVWNYTSHRHTELRVEIPLEISYSSSVALAEHIALSIVRDTQHVLSFPEPRLLIRTLGASGIELELRCWLSDPGEKAGVVDSVLRRIKVEFDEAGVHFPFPQRTVSYLSDGPAPAPTPEHLLGDRASKPVVLALVRSPISSPQTPGHIASFAAGIDARLVLLHVRPPASTMQTHDGQTALNKCVAAARRAGISVRARMEVGSLAATVSRITRQEGAKMLLLVRHSHHGLGRGWARAEQQAIQAATDVPVQLLEPDTPASEKTVSYWRDRLHPAPDAPSDVEPSAGAPLK